MSRCDLTDFEWRVIEPLLPNKPRGVPRVDDLHMLTDIFCALLQKESASLLIASDVNTAPRGTGDSSATP